MLNGNRVRALGGFQYGVGVERNHKHIAVGEIVIAAGVCFAVLSPVRVVEMPYQIRYVAVVVAREGRDRHASEDPGVQKARVLILFLVAVDLIAHRHDKAGVRHSVCRKAERILPSRGILLGTACTYADLRVADRDKAEAVFAVLRFVGVDFAPVAVRLVPVAIGCIRLKTLGGYLVGIILRACFGVSVSGRACARKRRCGFVKRRVRLYDLHDRLGL